MQEIAAIKTESTAKAILSKYTGEPGKEYQRTANEVSQEAYSLVAKARLDKLQNFIKPDDVVLEYGVGTGWNLAGLKCQRRIGYDICESLAQIVTRAGIDYINKISEVRDESIDVVICHHVLEHVSNPLKTLQCLRRILKPNGRLLLFVPSEHSRRFRRFVTSDPNHHLFSWSCQTLGNLVSSCGFKITICREQTFGYEKLVGTIVARLKGGYRLFRLLRHLCHLVRHDKEIFLFASR